MRAWSSPWQCGEDHSGMVSCEQCGWTVMQETIFVGDTYEIIQLQKRVNRSQIRDEEGRLNLKVTEFWLNEGAKPLE